MEEMKRDFEKKLATKDIEIERLKQKLKDKLEPQIQKRIKLEQNQEAVVLDGTKCHKIRYQLTDPVPH